MSLTTQDLTSIRGVVIDALDLDNIREVVIEALDLNNIRGVVIDALECIVQPQLDRLEADIKEMKLVLGEHSQQLINLSLQVNNLDKKVNDIDGRLKAVEADIKELYHLQSKSIPPYMSDKTFKKMTNPQKIITLHKALQHIAKANSAEPVARKP